jgi:alpha-N-arabinofuranosidase
MVCLAFRPQTNGLHLTGRETYLAPITWNKDGWPVVNGNGSIAINMDVNTLPQSEQKINRSFSLNFANLSHIGYDWVYLCNPTLSNYKLTSAGLELIGTDVTLDNSGNSPTFIAHRQQDINFSAETRVSLNDANPDAVAGLSVYMDSHSHYDLFVKQNDNNTQSIVLRYKLNRIEGEHILATSTKVGETVTLKVAGDADTYEFYCSYGNGLIKIGSLDSRYLSTETAGGFTGITLGLYATGHCVGVFKSFEYSSNVAEI